MGGMEILLEVVLAGLLGGTLLHAVRLQRSLVALRQDRAALHEAALGFDGGAREAERSLLRLKEVADRVEDQLRSAGALKDDLLFLSDRGGHLADQLEALVRAGRTLTMAASSPSAPVPEVALPPTLPPTLHQTLPPAPAAVQPRSVAERNLLLALQGRR